jgi:hypothetical protein
MKIMKKLLLSVSVCFLSMNSVLGILPCQIAGILGGMWSATNMLYRSGMFYPGMSYKEVAACVLPCCVGGYLLSNLCIQDRNNYAYLNLRAMDNDRTYSFKLNKENYNKYSKNAPWPTLPESLVAITAGVGTMLTAYGITKINS